MVGGTPHANAPSTKDNSTLSILRKRLELNMQWWMSFSEIIRNFGLVAGGAIGIFLAWQRVRVANKQAEARIR
jgi:hypothetical protein